MGSSEAVGSEASFSAVLSPLDCPRVCCARAQSDFEAGSDLEERAVRTAFCCPLAIRARC